MVDFMGFRDFHGISMGIQPIWDSSNYGMDPKEGTPIKLDG